MQKVYTTTDYQVKRGRFLILSKLEGDMCTEVGADVVDGTEKAYRIAVGLQASGNHLEGNNSYWIHEGFLIARSNDPHGCALTLNAESHEEATEELTRFLADLNAV